MSVSLPLGANLSSLLQDPCWQRLKKPLHLVECIHVLLSGYVSDPSRVPNYDRSGSLPLSRLHPTRGKNLYFRFKYFSVLD